MHYRRLLKIAVPSIVGFLALIIFEGVDIYWVGKLGNSQVAAVGAASFVLWALFSLMQFTTIGCTSLVAQFEGKENVLKRFNVIRDSFWLSISISIVIVLILLIFVADIFQFMGLDLETSSYALDYFDVLIKGFPILYILNLQGQIFTGYGDTKTGTFIMLVSVVLNIILDPILIFGWFGFYQFGIEGASLASVISQFFALCLSIWMLRRKGYIDELRTFFTLPGRFFRDILHIGIPSATTNFVWSMVFPFLTTIVTTFGMSALAGLNIGTRWEGIPYYFSLGISMAVTTLVGNSYGKGDHEDIIKIVKKGVVLISVLLFPIAIAFVAIPEFLVSILIQDGEIVKQGAEYLRIIGICELFLGWELVFQGAFNGLGNTRPYMFLSVPLTIVRFPLAYYLAINQDYGVNGVWWSISITTLLKGVGLGLIFIFKIKGLPRQEYVVESP